MWLDYDSLNNIARPYFYASNIAPLWAGCWDPSPSGVEVIVDKILKYVEQSQSTK